MTKDSKSSLKTFVKPSKQELKKILTDMQFRVTQEEGTEKPFSNEFWDNKHAGIYVDVVSGEPLFSSIDKFDSGTGWPSFVRPLVKDNIVEKKDRKFFVTRTEVRSKSGDSHLGHVFDDGPKPTGLRYCMNSASMRFVPVEKLEAEGYGEFKPLFAANTPSSSTSTTGSPKESARYETATLAGGCFWGMEEIIRKIPGVVSTEVGYTGGIVEKPTYEQVTTGKSGHAEAVQITFDPAKISFNDLLGFFFRMHDPTTVNRQGHDVGTQYRSAIFTHSDAQKKSAEQVIAQVNSAKKWSNPVVTEVVAFEKFWPAETYHQKYLEKNPAGYSCHYLR